MSLHLTHRLAPAAALVFLLLAQSTSAQSYKPRVPHGKHSDTASAGTKSQMQKLEGSGTIDAVARGALQVTLNGVSGLVKLDPKCKVEVTGMADPEFLRPGLLLRFNAEFDKKTGKALAPVNELEIVTMQTAMLDTPRALAAGGKKAEAQEAASASMVLAKLTGLKKNEMTLETASGTVKADLGPNPSIKVNADDYTVARPGDKIDVDGVVSPQGVGLATKIVIKLSSPLGADPKKAAAKTTSTASAK